jgi:hypothetical protein
MGRVICTRPPRAVLAAPGIRPRWAMVVRTPAFATARRPVRLGPIGALIVKRVSSRPCLAGRVVSFRLSGKRLTIFPLFGAGRCLFRLEAKPNMSVSSQLSFFRGEDVALDFTQSPTEDVTGWTITFTVKDVLGGTTQFTRSAAIVDGPRGRWRVSIASADTGSLPVGRYIWDARRTDPGNKATLADGFLDLRQECTP